MKTKILLLSLLTFALAACSNEQESVSQVSKDETLVVPLPCRVDTEGYTPAPKDVTKSGLTKADMPEKIIIPVVFHVFGSSQGSGTIDLARLEKVITWINNDFHGVRNPGDYHWNGNIVSEFDAVKAVLPEVEFRLAQFDPDGKPHTGLCMHTVAEGKGGGPGKGLGDSPAGNSYIKKYAWNNKMYMNVYITRTLYGEPSSDSGVAWPPSMSMTNAGTARV
ncbi:MAG: M43 family zinc metalloprotease, partial [Rikenellaceae bacterium]